MADDEWYTPVDIMESVWDVMGAVLLDPCSSKAAVESLPADLRPSLYLTKELDCLSPAFEKDWRGSVFMNPPYSREAGTAWPYVQRLIEAYQDGKIWEAIVIVNSSTATKYFQALAQNASARCDCSPRIRFEKVDEDGNRVPGSRPRYDNTIFYLGSSGRRFCNRFEEFGTTTRRIL